MGMVVARMLFISWLVGGFPLGFSFFSLIAIIAFGGGGIGQADVVDWGWVRLL
jgi:hypothetical protein